MSHSQTHIRIFYPADPVGVVPGGIDTFLRGLIKSAPDSLRFSLVGMTTDVQARPVGRWTTCSVGGREFDMLPVCAVRDAGSRGRVPLSVRFMAGVNRDRLAMAQGFDIFDFHRVEPALMWRHDQRPKNAFFHQDPRFVRQSASDNLWRHLPTLYERLERTAMADMRSAWCVRGSGVEALQQRYPDLASSIRFVPTWVDPDVFHPVSREQRAALRHSLAQRHGLDPADAWVISVGRLDTQKDPMRMLAAVARLREQGRTLRWLVVGDGVLRGEMVRAIEAAGLTPWVHFLGLMPPAEIADWLRVSDLYALSSAYEGMPMALLEAMGCGLPVVVTDVGEVRRVVQDGVNGRIATVPGAQAFAVALGEGLDQALAWQGEPALAAVRPYAPARVLAPVYENYQRLGASVAAVRQRASALGNYLANPSRPRQPVVGVPVDVVPTRTAVSRVMQWSREQASRTVCFVNVHSAVQASLDERHRWVLESADLAAPDGAPIAWTLRAKGHAGQPRVDGPDTMLHLLEQAAMQRVPIGLYGGSPNTLTQLQIELVLRFPGLRIAYAYSPPFRELTPQEDEQVCADIRASGAALLFVGLGCPKQEFWMASHRGRLPCVMLGVGAAFEFHAGLLHRAPRWMRRAGLEWVHRLAHQPDRLWRRYAYTNSLFVAKSLREAVRAAVDWLRARPSAPER
jgi:exopolysaccharide biosynthesis WecB/TagA/CpsF family protein